MSLSDYNVCAPMSTAGVRPAQVTTCTVHAPRTRPEPEVTETEANSAVSHFPRPEQPVPPERTSASQLAEANFREADELPSIVSRQRTARALRDLLAAHRMSVTKFAAIHDVNEKQAAKWLDGRANYPAWGFDLLSEEMADTLYAAVRGGHASGPNALRARINRLGKAELLDVLGLVTVALGKK